MENKFREFIREYESKVSNLSAETSLAYFDAVISGDQKKYKRASELQIQLSKIYSDKKEFELLKEFIKSDSIKNPLLKRQLTLIYNSYAANQFEPELNEKIINLSAKIEEKFSTYRAVINGAKLTDNEIDKILQESTNDQELKTVWQSSKSIGETVVDDIKEIVNLRNQAAQSLGYKNYHYMSLSLNEQDTESLDNLFDELDRLTKNDFAKLKSEIDVYLTHHLNIPQEQLMPWHYQDKFFQLGPKIYDINLDEFFADKDIIEITRSYFDSINLSIDDLLMNSDLYEREGKYQHAFCTDIDKKGDIRVVCNVKPNHKWMGTLLHEFGHAVYDKFIDPSLPWQLREHAHIFTTESIAMLFGRFASSPEWLHDVLDIPSEKIAALEKNCKLSLKMEQLIFSRWVQVVYRFEKELYNNPAQDLNSLWWQLVEKYQLIRKPEGRNEPDWASKIHIALYPAYYHNYMLGELLASQLYNFISENILNLNNSRQTSFAGKMEVGNYLIKNFFSHGAEYHWSELIKISTGEELTPEYYAKQFVSNNL